MTSSMTTSLSDSFPIGRELLNRSVSEIFSIKVANKETYTQAEKDTSTDRSLKACSARASISTIKHTVIK